MNAQVKTPLETAEQCNAAAIFTPAAVVDELGTVKALIAKLEKQEEMLKAALIAAGREDYEGNMFDCHVGKEQTRVTVKRKELEADLGPLEDKYLTTSKPFRNVTVTAKK